LRRYDVAKSRGGYQVRAVRSADDRKLGGEFFSLKPKESFEGYALFKPDPELSDNTGYFEYFEHYSKATGYVACAGPDDCPFCKTGDRPNTRAKSVWLVDGEVKVFNLNYSLIQELYDYLTEDEVVLGQLWRIKRLNDRGNYSVRLKPGKMTQKDLKESLKNVPDVEAITTTRMRKALEEMDAADALEDNGDGDEDEAPKARKGSKAEKTKAEPEPENEDIEDETVTITSVSKKNNTINVEYNDEDVLLYGTADIDVSDFKKGDEVVVSAATDADDDYVLSSLEPATQEEQAGDGVFEDTTGEVGKVTKSNKTAEVEVEGEDVVLWFTSDEDFEYAVKGASIVFSAEKDKDDDWVVSSVRSAEADGGSSELPDKFERETFTVANVDEQEETIDLEGEVDGTNYEFTLYFLKDGDASDVDFDDYKDGMEVIVTAVKDEDKDMVADEHVPEPVKPKSGKAGASGKSSKSSRGKAAAKA
jgi:hypothetical protein